jgi:hypothetical protein
MFAVTAYLALGCASLGGAEAGGGGGQPTLGSGSGGGVPTSSSAGAGGGASATGEATVTDKTSGPDFAACIANDTHALPVFLSAPHARAMVSATQVRGMLLGNQNDAVAPPPAGIRADELLSYYHIDYPASSSDDFTVVAELVDAAPAAPGAPLQLLLQVGVQAPRVMTAPSKQPRRQTSLTVVVDTSMSMAKGPIARANAAVAALASSLNAGDILNLVSTNTDVPVVHRIAASSGDPALFPLTSLFEVGGGGSLQTAVDRAYAAAKAGDSLLPSGINRVVVITDGAGQATDIAPEQLSAGWTSDHIQLVGVGVGAASTYRNDVLGAATAAGHGANLYLDSVNEAVPALHDRFDEVMDEAGRDVTVGIAAPSLLEMVDVDDSGAVAQSQLLTSDLGRGRSMVFRHFVKVCVGADSKALGTQTIDITTTWTDPVSGEPRSRDDHPMIQDLRHANPSHQAQKVAAIVAFGGALKSLTPSRFKDACKKVADARTALSNDPAGAQSDPELDSILLQIKAHPLTDPATCP